MGHGESLCVIMKPDKFGIVGERRFSFIILRGLEKISRQKKIYGLTGVAPLNTVRAYGMVTSNINNGLMFYNRIFELLSCFI